jgi:TatD DNase family protein
MNWFDSHCHLQGYLNKGILADVLTRADRNEVTRIAAVGTSPEDWSTYQNLSRQYKETIFYTVGLHPCYVNSNFGKEIEQMEDFFESNYLPVAVGEVGLDYFHLPNDKTLADQTIQMQKMAFGQQVAMALKFDLPLIVHSRGAFEDCMKILDFAQANWGKVLFHCFSEGEKQMQQLKDRGGRASVTGVLTYKKNDCVREAIKLQGIENIILETDSPYLSPVPKRGKENEPSNLTLIGEYTANFFGVEKKDVAHWSFLNASAFYGLDSK